MSAKKRQKRARDVADEYADHVITENENQIAAKTADKDLFVLDTVGSKSSRKRIVKTIAAAAEESTVKSKTDTTLIKKHLNKAAAAKSNDIVPATAIGGADLWDNDTSILPVNTKRTKKSDTVRSAIKTAMPVPGTSYNPSQAEHQKAIRVATEAEKAKLAKDAKEKGEIDTKLSEFTASFITNVASDDEEEEEVGSDEEEVVEGDGSAPRKRKAKGKLTKAERNKIRNRRDAEFALRKTQSAKELVKQLNMLPTIVKQIRKSDRTEKEAADQARKEKEEAAALKLHMEKTHEVMSHREAGAVPLSDELGGSIRTIRVKHGMLLKEEVDKLETAGEMNVFQRRRRRGGEKNPFAGKNVKWIPKYKYV
jgi:hypothetical protein